ncbi:EamA-like transporter family protein [Gimesia panareensis]|uniref:EamA-like transporter family protein n=1 Tax=Gimesia panareensis TaxID=2527978 RepID=A0A518FVQ9_9PLAN|nr:DMT family transporter [Gimesia panareensis]QDV20395.1 EamA-like transporter family protein [Gimesia panareensis]
MNKITKASSANPPEPVATDQIENQATDGMSPVLKGTLFGLLSALAYTAANISLREAAVDNNADWAIWISALKSVPATIVGWVLVTYRGSKGLPALPPRRLVIPLILTGLLMQFGGNVMFQWSLSLGGLAFTVPLCFATLLATGAILGRLFLEEAITPRMFVSMVILTGAIVVLSLGAHQAEESVFEHMTQHSRSMVTVALTVFVACVAGCAYGAGGVMIRGTVRGEMSISASLVLISTTGLVCLTAVAFYRLGFEILWKTTPWQYLVMLVGGIMNAIAFFAIGGSMKYLTVTRVNLLNASQTAMAAFAGVFFFNEELTVWLLSGTALTIGGLFLMEKKRPAVPNNSLTQATQADSMQQEVSSHE